MASTLVEYYQKTYRGAVQQPTSNTRSRRDLLISAIEDSCCLIGAEIQLACYCLLHRGDIYTHAYAEPLLGMLYK